MNKKSDNEFELLWDLPRLPLTECIGKSKDASRFCYDQELVIDSRTGHVQLKYQIDPKILYQKKSYSFRTGLSSSARHGVSSFLEFLRKLSGGKIFSSIVDIGGNDLYLAKHLKSYGNQVAVVDPVCEEYDGQIIDEITVIGQLIEHVDLSNDIQKPDLVVCRHTLEHISNPKKLIRQCFEQCTSDCLYVVEVPCFDSLVEALRFDAIFHQHYHYFSLETLKKLVWNCGGEYLDHAYNYQGSCGGVIVIAFRKADSHLSEPPAINVERKIKYLKDRIIMFTQQMNLMSKALAEMPEPVYGYGAGLMLATYAYHLDTDFSNLVCILDDDPSKDGMTYENVPVIVRYTEKANPPVDGSYIITSLENIRPIYQRIQVLRPRRVLLPCLS